MAVHAGLNRELCRISLCTAALEMEMSEVSAAGGGWFGMEHPISLTGIHVVVGYLRSA